MKTNSDIAARNKGIVRILIGTTLILLVPLVAMQFSDEVDWKLPDFIIIGSLLIGTGFLYELTAKKIRAKYRVAVGVVLLAVLLLIWTELAVGIFGTPFAGS